MRKYDLTVLLRSDMDQKARDEFTGDLEKLVKTLDGKPGKLSELGKKQLAYKIQKVSEALFLNWSLELPSEAVVQLDKKLTNDKEVLRHLLVIAEPAVREVKKRVNKS